MRRTSPSSITKSTSVFGSIPVASRTAWGIVTWPFDVIRIIVLAFLPANVRLASEVVKVGRRESSSGLHEAAPLAAAGQLLRQGGGLGYVRIRSMMSLGR